MTVDRSRAPSLAPSSSGPVDASTSPADLDPIDDEPWCGRSVADTISLSASASRRLAEPGRIRAFVLERLEGTSTETDAGNGRSIVLEAGLYGLAKRR